jgi:hypothetical protein
MIRPQTRFPANFTLPPVLLKDFAYRIVFRHVGHPVGILQAANSNDEGGR